MTGVVPNAYAKFQKNSINNESDEKARREGGLSMPDPAHMTPLLLAVTGIALYDRSSSKCICEVSEKFD